LIVNYSRMFGQRFSVFPEQILEPFFRVFFCIAGGYRSLSEDKVIAKISLVPRPLKLSFGLNTFVVA